MNVLSKNIFGLKNELKELDNKLSNKVCCFTGHRPQSLPWRFNEQDERCIKMKNKLNEEIIKAIKNGYTTFISGMALGFDMICAEIILQLKKEYPDIKLIGAIPCKTQDKLWNEKDKQRYKNILSKLDGVRCIYDDYIGPKCMLERNQYMINNSSLVIALFNGKNGGTKNTLDYVKKSGIKIDILDLSCIYK